MTERKQPSRRPRAPRKDRAETAGDLNPYADVPDPASPADAPPPPPPRIETELTPVTDIGAVLDRMSTRPSGRPTDSGDGASHPPRGRRARGRGGRSPRPAAASDMDFDRAFSGPSGSDDSDYSSSDNQRSSSVGESRSRYDRGRRNDRNGDSRRNTRRGRGKPRRGPHSGGESTARHDRGERGGPGNIAIPETVAGAATGWFDPARDAGYLRRAELSYLPDPSDTIIPPQLVRDFQLRRGDLIEVSYGYDQRDRAIAIELLTLNGQVPVPDEKRPDFNTLTASYPDRKLTLETGKPAKAGPELTRRAIDLIAPIGYGQRALIVAPARAGKTTLLQAIVEGVALNHPEAVLLILLVDERPEEVSEMIDWGYGEVVASSFDMPPKRHVEVAEMTLERARRLVELGKDVVIVLDSITRLARAHNTVDRGTGRTMSGGLDATAMQKPKAFFGSARMIAQQHGGGSLTIIATALVETGSRMDDVIFEEFKGTGNSEIKLDRSLADRRIFPAFDIATSGTRREEKLYRPDQLEKVYLLRRGLHQMPPQSAMEWLIKRIAGTSNNDSLLDGL